MVDEVKMLGARGIRTEDMAYYFDMSPRSFYRYCQEDERLLAAYQKGKLIANLAVSNSLFIQATEKDNVVAQIFWLKTQAGFKESEEINLNFIIQRFNKKSLNDLTDDELLEGATIARQVLKGETIEVHKNSPIKRSKRCKALKAPPNAPTRCGCKTTPTKNINDWKTPRRK